MPAYMLSSVSVLILSINEQLFVKVIIYYYVYTKGIKEKLWLPKWL